MAFTKLEPTGVNTSAIFTFSEANITGNITVNGHSNLGAVGNINITGGTDGQVLSTDGTGNLSWTTASGGSGSYSNSNVASYLLTNTGNIAAGYFIGNGSTLTYITGGNVDGQVGNALVASTVYSNAQPNITSVGTLTNLTVTSNVTAAYFIGNGSQLTGIVSGSNYSNSNVAAYLPTFTGNFAAGNGAITGIFTAGTLTAGSGAGGSISGANSISANYFTGTLTTGTQPNITSLGTLTSLNASGNVSGVYFIGNGSALTGLNASNISSGTIPSSVLGNSSHYIGTTSIALNRSSGSQSLTGVSIDGSAGSATTAGTVTTAAQPNITSVGTLVDANISGNLVVSGNLTVSGSTEYTNVTNLYVKDPIIEQGGGSNGAALSSNDGKDRGSLLHYYTTAPVDAFMGWDNSNGEFAFGSNVTMSSEVATFNTFGNVRAGYFIGNGSQLVGTIANSNYAAYAGDVVNATQSNITSVGTLASLSVTGLTTATGGVKTANILDTSGTVTLQTKYNSVSGDVGVVGNLVVGTGGTGNITATYLIGNGSQLTGIASGSNYSNANVAAYLPTYTGNLTAGNVAITGTFTAGTVTAGSGSGGTFSGANLVSANYFTGTLTTGSQPNITSIGTLASLNVTGNISSAANITASYLIGDGSQLTGLPASYANSNVASYLPTYTGNVSANYFIGNGSTLTHITGGNVDGQVANALVAGTVYTAAQPSITSVGTLASLTISANSNLTMSGSLSQLTGVNLVSGTYLAGTLTTAAQPNITSLGTLSSVSVTGLTTATGGVKTANILDASGTVTLQTKYNSVSGDVGVVGNLVVGTSGTGNITATYIIGNGSQLTGLPASYSNSNVTALLAEFGSNNITTTGNVTASYLIGNGSQLTGIVSGSNYSNANVAAYLPTYTGNISAGNIAYSGTFTLGSGTGGSLSGANAITSNYFVGNANFLSNIPAGNITGTISSLAFGLSSDTTTYVSSSTSGTVTCDTSTTGPVWYYTTIAGATTLNFTNLPTTDGRTTVVAVMFAGTTVVPSVQIAGSAQTIKWSTGTAPTGNASGINIYTFSCVRVNSAWTAILGSYSYYA